MRKIAIIKTGSIPYYEDQSLVSQSISDWAEVTEEQFNILCRYVHTKELTIFEFFPTEKIPFLVEEFMDLAKKEDEERIKQKEKAEKEKQERALKKQAKTEKQQRELLAQLQEKFKE